MKIGKARTLEEITPREWERMIEHAGVAKPYLKKRVSALAAAVEAAALPVMAELAHLDQASLEALGAHVIQRAKACVRSLPG